MRAQCLYEKFVEYSEDPIADMNIGYTAAIKKLKELTKWDYPESKDTMRIRDIITKSKGNPEKELMYARNMAKSITDVDKAVRRYKAAVQEQGETWPGTGPFLVKALELKGLI